MDLISRQAAIDYCYALINAENPSDPSDEWNYSQERINQTEVILHHLEFMPSAQPEPCVDTIDALNESIKHFDDMAEKCRRNANIERNDYMDMRDDAAEYRQLSIWLNELKWLRERFQSQPEIVRCGQCKYAEVADAQDNQDGYTCQFHRGSIWFSGSYCSWGERRTNERKA